MHHVPQRKGQEEVPFVWGLTRTGAECGFSLPATGALSIASKGSQPKPLSRRLAAIPYDHRSGAILILRNHSFEITGRMIFDMNREGFVAGNEIRSFGDRATTKRRVSGLAVSRSVRPEGSMVFEKSRLRL